MTTNPGQARTARSSTLRALALSTALAGSMTLLPTAARAQNNTPANPGTITVGPGGSAPVFTGPTNGSSTNMNVDLRAQSTIIEWQRFNIAQGSSVTFGTGLAGDVAVLNRVTGGSLSTIAGALNSDANVSVFLVNPNGIMVSGTGSVSTGSFVASTRDISNSDFINGAYQFSGNGSSGITVNGSITTRGTGIGLILLGAQVVSNGTLDSGTQDVALVAADDVTLNFTPGSPLGIQITRGTNVSQAMQIVGGSIQGRNVYFAMATRGSATNSLLRIDGDVRAVAGDKGIVIVGGQSSIDPDIQATGINTNNDVGVTVGGSLTYTGSAANAGVHIGGTDTVTVAGTVSSGGDYKVRGPSVTLGKASTTLLQQAQGGVSITAYDGDITGLGSLTLIADRSGAGGRPLVLDADGDIDFGSGTTLNAGGSSLASAVNIFSGSRNGNVRLGDVSGLRIDGGLSGGALEGKLVRAANILGNGGDITLGNVTLADAATIEADDLTLTSLTAPGAVSLKAANALRAGSVRSTGGTVTMEASTLSGVPAGSRANVSATGTATIDVNGSALLGTVESIGDLVSVTAGSLDVSSVSAATGATLITNTGDARVGGISVSAGSASVNADDDAFVTGAVTVSGSYNVTGDAVTLAGTQAAGGAVTITGRSNGTIGNSGSLNLTANSDGVGAEALTLQGRMNLNSTSTLNGGSARQSAVVISTPANSDISLGNVNGASLAIAGGANLTGDLVLGNVDTTADLSFVSSQSISAGNLTSGGLVSLQAPVLVTGDIQAATSVALSGRQIDFGAINAASATLATTGTSGTRRLNGLSITTSGAVTLTSASGAITVDAITAGGGLGVTSAGTVSFNTVGVTGDATITTTGANDIGLTSLTATGAVSLTSGDDIAAGSVTSSGGTVTINAADDLTGVGGGRGALSAAGALAVTAGGDARLGTVSGNTVNVQAVTIDAGAVSGPAGITLNATGGTLDLAGLSTTAGNVSVTASGAVTVDGPVSITGDYVVNGRGVTLGGVQGATGAVDITASGAGNTISSLAGLQLTANSDGLGTEALTLHGGANLGADSLLRGGPGRQSQVVIDSSAAGNFRLGDVDAGGLVIAGGAPLSGSLTFGNVITTGAVTLVVDGGITGAGITSTGGAVSLSGAGGATVGTLSGSTVDVAMQGNVSIDSFTATAGAANLGSTGGIVTLKSGSATGDVRVQGLGAVSIADAITAGGDYRVRGASVALGVDNGNEIQSAGGTVDITATSGAITGGTGLTLRSGTGALILDGAGGIDFGAGVLQAGASGTGQLGLRAGNGQTIDLGDSVKVGTIGSVDAGHTAIAAALTHNGNLRFGTLDAVNAVDIRLTSGNLIGTALNGAGTVAIDTGSGGIDLGTLHGTTLTVNGGALTGGSWTASGNAVLTGGTIALVTFDSTGGAASATTSAGTLSIDTAHAATDLTLTANGGGDLSVGTASAAGNVTLVALGGDILTDSATAGATLTLKSGGDILGRSGANPGLSGTDVVLEVVGNLTTGSITSPGGLSITSGSMNIGSVSAGTALSLTASNGAMTLGSASAGTAISLTASGAIDVGTLTSGAGATLGAGGALSVHQLTAPGAVTATAGGALTLDTVQAASLATHAASATLGTLTLGTLALTGGSASITDATVSGAVTSDLTGALDIGTLGAADVTLKAGSVRADSLTAGTLGVTAGSIDLTDAVVTGTATLTASGALDVDTLKAGSAVLQAGNATLGTLTLGTLTLTGGSASIANATVTGATSADLTGALAIDTLTGAGVTLKAGGITANTLTASGVTTLTGGTGGVDLGQLKGTGAITIGSAGNVSVDGWQAPAGLTITATNDVALGTGTASALTVTGRGITVTDATIAGAATLTASGALNVQALRGGNLAFRAASITADGLTATGTASLTSTTGTIDLGTLSGAGAITLGSADGVVIDSWQAPAGMTITAANAVNLGTGTASALTVTAGSIQLADGNVTGDANLTASGALGIGKLRAANAVLKGGSATLGTLTLGGLTLTGGSATITDATVSGTASIDLSGALGIDKLTAATATLLAGGTATLGNITGTSALTVRAGDLVLNGTLKAPTVTVGSRDAAGGLRLGAAADAAGPGLGLSESEIAKIDADRAVFDGGSGEVRVGTLKFGAQTGRSHVDILTTGDLKVVGVVEGEGAGRLFRFGGTATDNTLAKTIQILATADAGGRLFFGNADLELRGAKIALGQSGLLDLLFANGGASADQAAGLIGNSNSPLYSALAGGSPYVQGEETTLTAGRLTVRFDDFALFQNTGTRGFNTGVALGGSTSGGATLSLIGPGGGKRTAFAMFGTINGIGGTSTAVLGNTVINSTGIDLVNARVNGCVLGTAAGCLTTTISQPTLNVFDPGRLVVFRAEADFTLPFDPVIGSNNEALFAGVGSIAEPGEPGIEPQPMPQEQK
ncbi:filamentous hemagglutinin N-terminal domain-containing protein [Sphingomonas kyeonggiensis]|uniref:Filamentous hemagglutinin family protein n=1 Tax=Sphingomonas kyeonggiensis TaxID=1268553 RepID=A0A7W6JT58_9SPHN|nr:filamentous hemagglutinin N-terminal domain-containing protein [Sphingomonas kyeonggiensis]MBB4099010.1 filamentous hemagglutinin family protein [Sphingomonas kyeonggiensis]